MRPVEQYGGVVEIKVVSVSAYRFVSFPSVATVIETVATRALRQNFRVWRFSNSQITAVKGHGIVNRLSYNTNTRYCPTQLSRILVCFEGCKSSLRIALIHLNLLSSFFDVVVIVVIGIIEMWVYVWT